MKADAISRKDFIAASCFFLSGVAGLIYEVCWIRYASLVFGATSYALSTVLAVFFAGLALGSYVFGRISQRTEHPLRLFALMELAVGGLALASPFAFHLLDIIYGMAYRAVGEQFLLLTLVRIILVALVLLPPTILMGGTLPLFCRQYVDQEFRIAKAVGLLYGLNTLGAVCGCLLTGLLLLPGLGMFDSILTGAVLDFVVALAAFFLGLRARIHTHAVAASARSGGAHFSRRNLVVSFLLFLIGFVALGNEILWARHLALLIRNTVYTYTLTLAAVLLGIVIGSALAAYSFDRSSRRPFWFGALQVATGLVVLGLMLIPAAIWQRWQPLHLSAYFFLLLPAAILSGAAFPLGVRLVVNDPALAGIGVGVMAAMNTLGGILGSLVVGFIMLPAFGQQVTLLFTTGLSLLGGFLAWLLLEQRLKSVARWVWIAASLLVWVLLPWSSGTRLPVDFLVDSRFGDRLIAYEEGLSSNLAVIESPEGKKIMQINRLWQGQDRKNHQIMAAHVPMLLRSDPHRILLVGAGAGQTASRFLIYKVDRLDCVDIEPAVFDVIRAYFPSQWMDDERVRLFREDGRNFLAHSGDHYDVISLEVGQINRPGVPFFYTEEFYRRARERLTPGGFLSQFMPLPYFTPEQFRSAVATFLRVFPESFLWYNRSEMLLIGVKAPQLQIEGERLVLLEPDILGDNEVRRDMNISLTRDRLYNQRDRFVFLGSFITGPEGLAAMSSGAPLFHDDRPVLDYAVAKVSKRDTNEIPITALLRRYLEPVDRYLLLPLGGEEKKKIAEVRRHNLDDIVEMAERRRAIKEEYLEW